MGIHFYDDMQTNLNTLEFVKGLTTKPIWLIETGKPSATENNTETVQAEYMNSVYSPFEPLVKKIFIYELCDNQGFSFDKENYFGLLTADGAKEGAYWVVCDINTKRNESVG
jgi:hypothetical protein